GNGSEVRNRRQCPWRRTVEPGTIGVAPDDGGIAGLVEIEELEVGIESDVAATAQEPGYADALRHVLLAVPGLEFASPFTGKIVPDGDRSSAGETHAVNPCWRHNRTICSRSPVLTPS